MTTPIVDGTPPQRAANPSVDTRLTPSVGAFARAAEGSSSVRDTAALFTSMLQNSMLDSITAIGDESTDAPDDASADVGIDMAALFGGELRALGSTGLGDASSGVSTLSTPGVITPPTVRSDSGAAANAATVAGVARKIGVDPVAAVAMMLVESGGNAHAVGDGGTSFGLFQLHEGGMLTAAGLSRDEAFDPATNAKVSLTSLAHQYAIGPRRSAGTIAAASQRPADAAGYARRVDGMMDRARALLADAGVSG